MNILITGPAGSGKGTMSEKILKRYAIPHISTGDMLRKAIQQQAPYGIEAKKHMDNGLLVPDEVIHQIIEARLKEKDLNNGFLADGYPRTLPQAEKFDTILNGLGKKVDAVINLTIEFEVLAERITGRRLCPSCGAIYHTKNKPSQSDDVCDVCGSKLIQRSDDTVEQLKVRLEEHRKNTEPVLKHYRAQGIVHDVNAALDMDTVFKNICAIIEGLQ